MKNLEEKQKEMRLRLTNKSKIKENKELKRFHSKIRILPRLKSSERVVYNSLLQNGYDVLRGGWPDFLAVKGREIIMVEVKSKNDRLSGTQRIMHETLRKLGARVDVVRV